VAKLPDGSTAVFDSATQTIHALDASTAAVWEACREPKTLSELTDAMRRESGEATGDTVLEAVSELERTGLVAVSGATGLLHDASRRSLLKAAGIAVPVVLSLTAAEQRAFAAVASSALTTRQPVP